LDSRETAQGFRLFWSNHGAEIEGVFDVNSVLPIPDLRPPLATDPSCRREDMVEARRKKKAEECRHSGASGNGVRHAIAGLVTV
jgi:hypothetical protein